MCPQLTRELGRGARVVSEAREFVVSTLQRWGLSQLSPDAELMVSELVTNALVHARSAVSLTVAVADETLEVAVADGSPDPPRPPWSASAQSGGPSGSAYAEGGRGLHLVDRLADSWGVTVLAQGKQVWFRLATRRPSATGPA